MRTRSGRWALGILLLACCWPAPAQIIGRPPITRLTPDIETFPQSFDVVQDATGVTYMAVSDGVLVYGGSRWRLIEMPNHELVRSLAVGPDGRVYVGGYGQIGYISRGADGFERYTELTEQVRPLLGDRGFADVWRLLVTPGGVWFQAIRDLFRYDPATGTFNHWHHPGRFGAMLWHDDTLWLQWRGEGLKRLVPGDRFELVAGGAALTEHLYHLLARPDGALLGLSYDGSWPVLRDGAVTAFPAADALGPATGYSEALMLPDGTLVAASSDGVLTFVGPGGRITNRLRIGNDWIAGLFATTDGMILATTNGIELVAVAWPPQWNVVDAANGLTGTITALREFQGELHTLGSSGVFRLEDSGMGAMTAVPLPWTEFEAWDLHVDGARALLADSYQLVEIRDDGTRLLSGNDLYPRVIEPSVHIPGRLWVGTEHGLAVVEEVAGRWELVSRIDRSDVMVATIVELGPHDLLLGTLTGGLLQVRVGADLSDLDSLETVSLDYGRRREAGVYRLDDRIYASTEGGLHVLRPDGSWQPTDLDGLRPQMRPHETVALAAGPDGSHWAFGFDRIYRQTPGNEWHRLQTRSMTRGPISSLDFTAGGRAVFGTASALLVFVGARDAMVGGAFPVRLREVKYQVPGSDPARQLPLTSDSVLRFQSRPQSFQFRYGKPDLHAPDAVRYQARLLGFEEDFSDWSQVTSYTYASLKPGSYRFEARARDAEGRISEIRPFELVIEPPWYATGVARAAAVASLLLFGVLAGLLLMRRRTRKLRAHNVELERAVAIRTQELQSANARLRDLAHRDGLTDIANRRRFDHLLVATFGQRPLSLLMLDVDRFKEFNDLRGHLAGDDVLRRIAALIDQRARSVSGAVAARYGGEEFAVLLPGVAAEQAQALAEQLRDDIARDGGDLTVSVGVACAIDGDDDPEALLARADRALYQAKQTGRNRVSLA